MRGWLAVKRVCSGMEVKVRMGKMGWAESPPAQAPGLLPAFAAGPVPASGSMSGSIQTSFHWKTQDCAWHLEAFPCLFEPVPKGGLH